MMTPCLEVEDAAATNHNGNGIEDDEEIGFEFNGNDVEDSDGEDNGVVEQVGFGHVDEFDVLEVLEYGTEIKKDDEDETTEDIIKELKHGCVSTNSKKIIFLTLLFFIIYIYKFDRHLLHNSWSVTLDSFTNCIDDEKKKNVVMKKTIKKLLGMVKEEAPPIDFSDYTPQHFIKYLLSLRSEKHTRLRIA